MAESFRIGVVWAGYVGLVTGACLTHVGHRAPGGSLSPVRRDSKMPREADAIFLAVNTPQGDDGSADLSSVAEVARGIGRTLVTGGAGFSGATSASGCSRRATAWSAWTTS